jgi:hypothetical protein
MRKWNESSCPLKPAERIDGRDLVGHCLVDALETSSIQYRFPGDRAAASESLVLIAFDGSTADQVVLEVQPATDFLRQRNVLGNAQYSRPSDIAENSRILAAPNEANEKAAHRAAFVHRVGEIASVDFFDHPALARVDQIRPVLTLDIPVFTK